MKVHTTLQTLDVATTLYVVGSGGYEANPLMKATVANPVQFMALKMAITGMASKLPAKDIKALNYIYSGIVLNNIYQIGKHGI